MKLGLSPCSSRQSASPCPRWEQPPIDPGVGGAGIKLGGSFGFHLRQLAYAGVCSGLRAIGLDFREGCSIFWFKSDEGLHVKIDAAF